MKKKIIIIIALLLIMCSTILIVIKIKSDKTIEEQKLVQRIDQIEFDDDEYEYDLDYTEEVDGKEPDNKNEMFANNVTDSIEFDGSDDYQENDKDDNNPTIIANEDEEKGDGITTSTITDNNNETLVIPD